MRVELSEMQVAASEAADLTVQAAEAHAGLPGAYPTQRIDHRGDLANTTGGMGRFIRRDSAWVNPVPARGQLFSSLNGNLRTDGEGQSERH